MPAEPLASPELKRPRKPIATTLLEVAEPAA